MLDFSDDFAVSGGVLNTDLVNLRWPTSAIVLVFVFSVIVVICKHNKFKQRRCQNESSKIYICLMQRDVISVNSVN